MLGLLSRTKHLILASRIKHSFSSREISQSAPKVVYEPLPKRRKGISPVKYLHQQLLKQYDPLGKRSALVDRKNGVRSGDTVKVTWTDRSIVFGRVLGIKRGEYNLGTNILIRNKITKLGCEVRVPVFSPKVANIEIVDMPEKYLPRQKHYYVRNTMYDVGDVEAAIRGKQADTLKKLSHK